MSLSERTLSRIEKFFLKHGFEPSGISEEPDELILYNGREKILVKVVFEEDADKTIVYDACTSVVEKASEFNMVYVAVHRSLGDRMDTVIFMKRGVGLIVYDDWSIEEKVPAKMLKKAPIVKNQEIVGTEVVERSIRRLESSIREISERIDSLERAYLSLLREVREIKSILGKRIMIVEKPVEPSITKPEEAVESGGLPSFLKDNPWVEILSKRSEENP
ncbi:MAG: hypothetical protein FGF52_05315 [Candidatus Brockarchaeota archaeon]|nr:hypothetical protein [Candidatus Brockarchaeota archaeon]